MRPAGKAQSGGFVRHHFQPFGHQGPPTVENISLRCRAHNVYESGLVFGRFESSVVRKCAENYAVSLEIESFRNGGGAAAATESA